MTLPPRQLPFSFPETENWTAEDFILSDANRAAWDMLHRWPDWPDRILWLTGPDGSGKSHLLALWRTTAPATVLSLEALMAEPALGLIQPGGLYLLDDARLALLSRGSEEALFHLVNAVRQQQAWLVFASALPPAALAIALPDLRSRLLALPVVGIEMPDDAMLAQLLMKQLADRQLEVERRVLNYLVTHAERSYQGVRRVVRRIDQLTLALKQPVTIPLVKAALALDEADET